ncbi:MAG TPA: hypothetical protein VE439_11165 [Anaerolineae bacterium]|jgi:hypothetical protein|nr:hypothetical protein [Anaerolineae bacterium]
MAQTPDETRREIEETRLRIAEAVEELEERIEETTNWRKVVNRYPYESVAVALGVGFILGAGLLFRLPRTLRTTGRAASAGAGALRFLRPIITPVITSAVTSYVRRRTR